MLPGRIVLCLPLPPVKSLTAKTACASGRGVDERHSTRGCTGCFKRQRAFDFIETREVFAIVTRCC